MERNIQKIGVINFIILLLAGGISYVLAAYTNSYAGQVGGVFFIIGFLVAVISFFQMGLEEKERLEKLEFDEINRDKNAASLFSTEADTFPARRSREQFERFFPAWFHRFSVPDRSGRGLLSVALAGPIDRFRAEARDGGAGALCRPGADRFSPR